MSDCRLALAALLPPVSCDFTAVVAEPLAREA